MFRRRSSDVAIAVAPSSSGGGASPRTNHPFSWWRGPILGFLLGVAACAASLSGGGGAAKAASALAALKAAANPLPSSSSPATPLPCAASGLCSLSRVRPWIGDLTSSQNFRAALRARSHKSELVLLCTDGRSLDFTLQPIAQLARLGMSHHLLLADSRETCDRAREAIDKASESSSTPFSLGCGWYGDGGSSSGSDGQNPTTPLLPPRVQGAFRLWALRLRTALRAVRLGRNVLVLDADTVLFDDPYPYLKHADLLGRFQWVAQPESADGDREGGGGYLNGGVYYIQGAAPSGAAAFLLYEATRRMLRWDDDGRGTLRSYWRVAPGKGVVDGPIGAAAAGEEDEGALAAALPPSCCDADQDLLNDVFRTMRTGTLTSACALRCALDGVWQREREAKKKERTTAAAAADDDDDEGQEEPPERTRARLNAILMRIEDEEAGCDDYWRTESLSRAPEWSWPVIYGPTSHGFPDEGAAALGAGDAREDQSGNNGTQMAAAADALRRAHYARRNVEDPARVRWGELRVMNARGFDKRLGGRFYPPHPRGRFSRALDAQLRDDCPRCPALWPDPEDPAMASVADAVPRERLALMPPWLLTSWQAHGWRGYWAASPLAGAPGPRGGRAGGDDGGEKRGATAAAALDRLVQTTFPLFPAPSQLLGHVWFVPEATGSLKLVKRVLQMASGAYDWPLALGALGPGAFSACRDLADLPPGAPGARFKPMGAPCGGSSGVRVLALHPDAERALLSAAASWDEYASVAAGLADAAAALGRVPAWPSVDCGAAEAWSLQSGGEEDGEEDSRPGGGLVVKDAALAQRQPLPLSPPRRRRLPPYGGLSPRVIVDHRGRCFPWAMAIPACLNLGKGMLPWELDAWLAHQAPAIAGVTMKRKDEGEEARAAAGGSDASSSSSSTSWTPEPREGVNVIRLRLDAKDETRRAHLEHLAAQRELQGLEEAGEGQDGDDDDDDDDERASEDDNSSRPSSMLLDDNDDDDDPAAAPPPTVPGWRVPLLLLDAARLQAAAEALGANDNPVLYLSAPVALAPGSLTDDNDFLGGRARLAGARRECFPLVPGALAEIRRNELNARAKELGQKADEEAARAEAATAGGDAEGAASARRREEGLRREAARLESQARDEDALHYLLHDMSEPTRRTGLLSWAAEGLWRGVPEAGAEAAEVAA
jgi:hypothetical protein